MPDHTFTFDGADGTPIAAYRWDPDGAAGGIAQITHGVGEFAQRYDHVARTLTARGFVVYAQDHRGHGASVRPGDEQGVIGPAGWRALVDDIGLLSAVARGEHPGLPLVLVAHSLGSFATQQYLIDHSADVTAVVMTGTASVELLGPALAAEGPIGLEAFNAPFEPSRTDFDWLSRDDAEVDAYIADSRCGFMLDPEAFRAALVGAARAAEPDVVARVRTDLPIRIAVGEKDPVNGELALVTPLVDRYRTAGLTDVSLVVYPGARHEIFNETNRDEVIADMLAWLDEHSLVPSG